MARMPGALWRPLPLPKDPPRMGAYDILCIHTMVGSLWGTDAYFRNQGPGGTNSHFGVGADGTIVQWVDTVYRSGANYSGNWHIVSVENADTGAGFPTWGDSDVPALTDAQVEANAAIARWANATHGIPLEQIADARPGRRGVGVHRLGVPGYMVAGAEAWSTRNRKACPGDRRIAQVPEIIARARQEEDDMPSAEDVAKAIWNEVLTLPDGSKASARTVVTAIRQSQKSMQADLDDLQSKVAALQAPPESPEPPAA